MILGWCMSVATRIKLGGWWKNGPKEAKGNRLEEGRRKTWPSTAWRRGRSTITEYAGVLHRQSDVRLHALDGAMFPHIVKVEYTVDGQTYTKRKWIGAGHPTPSVGSSVTVLYDGNKPSRTKVV